MSYAVNFGSLSGSIYAGRVNKAGNAFSSKDNVTGQAIWAVAEWLLAHAEGDGSPYEITSGDVTIRLTAEVA